MVTYYFRMDDVFKALADPTRRALLDALYERDGQSLTDLEQPLPMTRFGVMKHLRVLEDAGVIVTRKHGREKLHFLNVVPIRLIYERWVSKYAEGFAAALVDLKQELEQEGTMEKVFEIYIKTSPEKLWDAITNPEMRSKYAFGVGVFSDWKVGSQYEGRTPKAPMAIFGGENLVVDPPRKLVQSFNALWSEGANAHGASRITWEIVQIEDSCKLTLTHDQLRADAPEELYGGHPMILSGLKTLLETGQKLTTPGSLMYA
jgi:DNA-binding transcriptional ArsR family regulator